MRPIFESYSQSVSATNAGDLDNSVMDWARDYLSLIALRPGRCIQFVYSRQSWWRGTVVERQSLTGELSLSCARPAADG